MRQFFSALRLLVAVWMATGCGGTLDASVSSNALADASAKGPACDAMWCSSGCCSSAQCEAGTTTSACVGAIVAGDEHTCVLKSDGVKCWGGNSAGQLGDGTTTDRTTPTPVSGMTSGVTTIAAGSLNTCAMLSGGAVQCWGYNSAGPARRSGDQEPHHADACIRPDERGHSHQLVRLAHMRAALGRRGPVLGRELSGPGGRRDDDRSCCADPCVGSDKRRRLHSPRATRARCSRAARSSAGATTRPAHSATGRLPIAPRRRRYQVCKAASSQSLPAVS